VSVKSQCIVVTDGGELRDLGYTYLSLTWRRIVFNMNIIILCRIRSRLFELHYLLEIILLKFTIFTLCIKCNVHCLHRKHDYSVSRVFRVLCEEHFEL